LRDALTSGRCHLATRTGTAPNPAMLTLFGWTTPQTSLSDPVARGPRVGYVDGNKVGLIPNAVVDVLRDAQRHGGVDPNLRRERVGRLWHDRGWISRNADRRTFGERWRIGTRRLSVWAMPLDVLFGEVAVCDDDGDVDDIETTLAASSYSASTTITRDDPTPTETVTLFRDQFDAVETDR
jgi:hypothetical protein